MKKKLRLKKKFILPVILISIGLLVFSSINIISWLIDSSKTDKQIETITENTKIEEKEDTEDTVIIEQEVPKEDPYWDYINMNLIDVDLKELKQKNPDTIGWIKVNGTNINYPFVQTNNNDYYLNHSFDKTSNQAGWVYLDYRNNKNLLNKNNIIYAHGRQDKTMFGSLKYILESTWIGNKDNYVIKISTEESNTLWQVFSIYTIPTTNDYIQTDFINDKEFLNLANKLTKRSKHDFKTQVLETDKILTLSTCYDDTNKTVLHAKLIKYEQK